MLRRLQIDETHRVPLVAHRDPVDRSFGLNAYAG
jgi:hypothetical protein